MAQDAGSRRLEEVVITARKRGVAETLQDVPISASALNGKQIEAMFAEDLTDVGKTAPNVVLTPNGNFPSTANFFIRGMGLFSSIPSDEPTVGIFSDGMYLGVNLGANTDFFDLESIEILRGPQGTLFGRNVTGGAVQLRSARPTEDWQYKIRGTLGNFDRTDLAVSAGGSLDGEGKVLGKVAASYKNHEGFWNNEAVAGDRVGEATVTTVKPILVLQPSESLQLSFITEVGKESSEGLQTRSLPYQFNPKTTMGHDEPADFETEWRNAILEANWSVGSGELTSITAYRTVDIEGFGDIDGSPEPIFNVGFALDQQQFSQELRYATPINDRSDVTAGVYYFEQDFEYREQREIFGGAVLQAARGFIDHRALGVFAQGQYRLNESLTASLGVRYTDEQKDARLASLAECSFDFSVCDFSFSDSQGWDFLSGHAGIQWFVSDDINLFVSWNRSFRSGGYNVRNASPATVPGPYDEEQVDAFELGLKSDWLDGRLRLNAAVFQNNYQDLQRTVLDLSLAQRILNAAEAEIRGVELEAFALITDRLSVQASVGLLDAEYAEFNGLDVDGDGAPDPAAAADLDLANVPELTGHLAATYDLPLDGLGTLTFRGSYSYTDGSPANDQNTIFVSSFSLIDASMTFADTSQRWRVSLFGKNLSDEVYARFAVTSSLFNFDYALPPRTWGLEVSYEM
jgi:outer membrane receptor protein involved in Fe transport